VIHNPVGRRRRVRMLLGALLAVSATAVVAVVGPASASATRQAKVCPSGCSFTTISAALAAARDGDKITVAPGTYAGGFTIEKSVTLKGAGAGDTVIAGGWPVITVAAGTDVEIKDVTVTGGGGEGGETELGGGIRNAGELTVAQSTIERNVASRLSGEGQGGGIYNEATGDDGEMYPLYVTAGTRYMAGDFAHAAALDAAGVALARGLGDIT